MEGETIVCKYQQLNNQTYEDKNFQSYHHR